MGNLICFKEKPGVFYLGVVGVVFISGYFLIKPLTRALARLFEKHLEEDRKKHRPLRIILIRHGQSQANDDLSIYGTTPDHKICLSEKGIAQAKEAGVQLKKIIGNQKSKFMISPYQRTRQTFENIVSSLDGNNYDFEEETLIRELEIGNLVDFKSSENVMEKRKQISPFYFRFNSGESGSDVHERATLFLACLFRQFDRLSINYTKYYDNYILVSHGYFINCFLMRLLNWKVKDFELTDTPHNCQILILEKDSNGKYTLSKETQLKKRDPELNELTKDK
jgi:broad specificity phosphatase PhoE